MMRERVGLRGRAAAWFRGPSLQALARDAAGALARNPVLVVGLLALAIWGRTAPAVSALPESARAVYQATMSLGTLGLAYSLLGRAVAAAVEESGFASFVMWLIERGVLFSLLLVVERKFGDWIGASIAAAIARPAEALELGAAALLVLVVMRAGANRGLVAGATRGASLSAPGYAVSSAEPRSPRSPQDVHRTAIHEAGHLILFGTRSELPKSLTVTVYGSLGPQDEYRGLVSHEREAADVTMQSDLHWSMLMSLAGSEAEALVFGERANGAVEDNRRWLSAAGDYLASGFGEVYYVDVMSDAQRDHNRAVLNSLKAMCQTQLQALLAANRALLEEVAAAIVAHQTMTVDQLRPLLARVVEPSPN